MSSELSQSCHNVDELLGTIYRYNPNLEQTKDPNKMLSISMSLNSFPILETPMNWKLSSPYLTEKLKSSII